MENKEDYAGHPKFYKLIEELAKLHDRKNKQYASKENPLGNFKRVSQFYKKLFNPILWDDPERLALAYAILLAAKHVDGVNEILSQNKINTPDTLQEKLRDTAVYYCLADVIEDDRLETKNKFEEIDRQHKIYMKKFEENNDSSLG